ncbi:YCF48-related protein [Desulfosporosinus sp. PR]|uniref:YCF48-related protein n=1 Tax=Candidatus Desulfosporosinus nitrosoreducens TaxID=3401928 RepID=UPI0027E78F5E|nr:YCF48-related protein [Desulfosporosinus sp. PR]MDQ7095718.1 YCF48-related protein [Desulfosporosinus sp. PR]
MKKLAIVLLIIFLLSGCSPANRSKQGLSWGGSVAETPTVSLSPQTLKPGDAISVSGENNCFSLRSLDFLDENNGWVIRERTDSRNLERKSQLLQTRDGGMHWAEIGSDGNTLDEVKFVDSHEGWAISQAGQVETNPGPVQYSVMQTMDGGATWNVQWQGQQTSASGLGLWFQDAAHGFALVADTLLATQNGGREWTKVSFGAGDFIPQSMSFTDAQTGGVAGVNGQQNVLTVLHTSDGGKSWQRQFQKSNSGSGIMGIIGLDFVDARTGWFLTSDLDTRNGDLYHTDDGGSNWKKINQIKCVRPTPTSLHFISPKVGWIPLDVGAEPIDGGLTYTRDGGKSFQVVGRSGAGDPDGTQKITSARDVDFISGEQGWAIGLSISMSNGDYLIRTKDGGNTWDQVYPKLMPTKDISIVDGQNGYGLTTLSDFGALLYTSDGGSSWQILKSFAQKYRPDKLSFIDAKTGWMLASPVATNRTVVLHTSDGGGTWAELSSFSTYLETDYFRFFDANNGIAIDGGIDGGFYRTKDGGQTWDFTPREIPENGINQFAFRSPIEGWEICNPGNYKTPYDIAVSSMTDGTAWQAPIGIRPGAWSYALTFLSGQKAMLLAEEPPFNQDSRMELLVTADAGKTWEPHPLPEGINGFSIVLLQNQLPMQFAGDLHGWILTAYGLLVTQDGGKTWTWK